MQITHYMYSNKGRNKKILAASGNLTHLIKHRLVASRVQALVAHGRRGRRRRGIPIAHDNLLLEGLKLLQLLSLVEKGCESLDLRGTNATTATTSIKTTRWRLRVLTNQSLERRVINEKNVVKGPHFIGDIHTVLYCCIVFCTQISSSTLCVYVGHCVNTLIRHMNLI